mmetsp:Transcript_14213/g.41371  ORF Transcript_14213/g.41371 Transcript_14213/m.41371 type:complete len:208 (+) Transcript_14213:1667-2290(+)
MDGRKCWPCVGAMCCLCRGTPQCCTERWMSTPPANLALAVGCNSCCAGLFPEFNCQHGIFVQHSSRFWQVLHRACVKPKAITANAKTHTKQSQQVSKWSSWFADPQERCFSVTGPIVLKGWMEGPLGRHAACTDVDSSTAGSASPNGGHQRWCSRRAVAALGWAVLCAPGQPRPARPLTVDGGAGAYAASLRRAVSALGWAALCAPR